MKGEKKVNKTEEAKKEEKGVQLTNEELSSVSAGFEIPEFGIDLKNQPAER